MGVKNIVTKALRFIGMGILFLLVLELAARTDDAVTWDAPFWSNYSNDLLSVSDMYGWHNRPNARFQKWEINSFGFRGPEITREKPDSVIRIVCVGASATFGLFESPQMEYPAQIQAMLDERYPGRFQVLNAACPGMSPPRITYYFNTWLTQFAPDILTYYPASDFYLNAVPPSKEIITQELPSQPSMQPRLAGKLRIVFKQFIPQSWQMAYKRQQMEQRIADHPADWLWQTPPPERVELFRDHIIDLVSQVESHGTQVVLATKANSISKELTDWDRYNMTNWRYFHIRASEACLLEMDLQAQGVIRDVGSQLNVPVADVAPLLPKTPDYFADSGHFTDKGARIVAAAITEKILELVKNRPDLALE